MSQPIDTLTIEIEANASQSVEGVKKLARALTSLSTSIGKVNSAGISNVSNSLNNMSRVFVNVGNSSGKASSGTKKFANILPTLTGHTNKASKSTKSLAYYFGKFYANMFLAVRGAKTLGSAVSNTMNYMESFNFWDVSIDSASAKEVGKESAEAYVQGIKERLAEFNQKMTGFKMDTVTGDISISNMANLGVNLENLTTFQAEIISVTSSLGLCTSVSEDTSKALSMLVADMSSLKNLDLKTVMTNFQSGLIGQSRALYKYGIDITNATLQTYAYEYGIEKAVSEMTQAEKMQLRLLAILDQSKVAWGDLANTIEQPSNQLRVLKNGVKNLAITIGKLLMPIVSATLPYLNAMVKALQRFAEWIAKVFGVKLEVQNSAQGTTDIFEGIEDSADSATDSVEALKKATTTLGIDELNINNPNNGSGNDSGSSSGGGGVDLSDEINNALAEYEKAWEEAYANMNDKATEMADTIVDAFKRKDYKGIGLYISTGITNALNSINWSTVYSVADQFGSGLAQFLNGLITPEEFGTIGKTVAGALNTALYSIGSFGENFDFNNLGVSIAARINEFFVTFDFKELAVTLNTWANGIRDTILEVIKNIDWLDLLSGIWDFLSNLGIFDFAAYWFKEAKKSFENAFEADSFLEIGGWIINGIVEGFSGILMTITAPFANFFTWVWEGICSVFGIASPAKEMKPLGEYILLGILEGFTGAFGNIKKTIEELLKKFDTFKSNIKKWCSDTKGKIEEWAGEVSDKFIEWKDNVEKTVTEWKDNLKDKFDTWKSNTSSTVEKWVNDVKSKFNTWKSNVSSTIENWKNEIQAKFNTWKINVINTVGGWYNEVTNKFTTFKNTAIGKIIDWYNNVVWKFQEFKNQSVNKVNEWYNETVNKFGEFYNSVVSKVSEWYNQVVWKFTDFKNQAVNKISEWYNGVVNKFGEFYNTVVNKVSEWYNQVVWKFTDFKNQVISKVSEWYNSVVWKFQEFYNAIVNKVSEWYNAVVDKFVTFKGTVVSKIAEWYNETVNKFGEFYNSVVNKVSEWYNAVVSKFTAFKDTVIGKVTDWYNNVVWKFQEFKNSVIWTLTQWFNEAAAFFGIDKWNFSGIKDGLSKAFSSAIETISGLWSRFVSWITGETVTMETVFVTETTELGLSDEAQSLSNNNSNTSSNKNSNTTTKTSTNNKKVVSNKLTMEAFAGGGITTADIFMANENGIPELIGTLGGKTAIASGMEVTGITDAIYDTGSEEIRLLREQNALLMRLLEKDMSVNIGDREIARANARGKRSMGYNLITEM